LFAYQNDPKLTNIKEIICYGPWVAQDDQFALLMLFVGELGMSLENEDQRYSSTHKR
jgi:hypothetical protein